jgi:flagellar biosynthesis/type III secretory pathway protein FliH
MDYAELVKRLQSLKLHFYPVGEDEVHFTLTGQHTEPGDMDEWDMLGIHREAANAIEALIRERDDLIAAAEKDAWDTAFKLQEVDNAAYERGFKDGLEKAAAAAADNVFFCEYCNTTISLTNTIRALIPEPNQSPPAETRSASPIADGIDAQ